MLILVQRELENTEPRFHTDYINTLSMYNYVRPRQTSHQKKESINLIKKQGIHLCVTIDDVMTPMNLKKR